MTFPVSDLPDDELVERFEDLLWRVGVKIGERHNDGGFSSQIRSEIGHLKWMTLVGVYTQKFVGTVTMHASVDCFDDTGVVFKRATINGKLKETPVYIYPVMRRYLPLLEQQVALELLSEIAEA